MKRRGVSPVIATLLLIVIAVVAAVLAYIWVSGYMGRVTSQAEGQASQLQERIKIDAVKVTGARVDINVTNIGDVDVTIASAYVLFENKTAVCSSAPNKNISRGIAGYVSVSNCNLVTGTTYIAKVVTSKGVEATYSF
ncbi:MAG: archaellin/type IV pilin N-terminal domain-containing protein, partial [Thermofilaceae archaeon]